MRPVRMKKALKFLLRFLGIEEGMDSPHGDDLEVNVERVYKYNYDERMDDLGSIVSSDADEEEANESMDVLRVDVEEDFEVFKDEATIGGEADNEDANDEEEDVVDRLD